ncbi:hypothetical protein ACFVH0_31820 [Streptomyces sp. NPDC127117]|uniref:hypothetical protein n=1 Tax=Streptomyces sp. NPDC127117 TaxID=3345368 RepID=UPI003632EF7E
MGPSHRAADRAATGPADERQQEVLDWYASRSGGRGAEQAWPEGAVVVMGRDLLPRDADLAAMGCRVAARISPDDWRRGSAERSVPSSAEYVLVVVARQRFDLRLAGDIVDFGRRTGLPVGVLPARSTGELGFMLRRMALARRTRAGKHVLVDAADSSSVVGDAAEFADPGAAGVHSVSVYGHGNESHVKIGDRFVCAHSASGFPAQDCECAQHGLRLCRLDDIRCVWIHLGSCGALVPDWRRSLPATNFVDSFASSYAATLCGSLHRMPTSRRAIVGHELEQLDGAAPGGADRSAGTLCLGDPVLLRHGHGIPDRKAAVASLADELKGIEAGLARLSEDRERLLALTRTVDDARGMVVSLRLTGGPAAHGALDACARGIDSASGWAVRAAAVLSAANERTLYGDTVRADFTRCVARVEGLAERFERELASCVASVPAIGARAVERAMKAGLLFGPTGSQVLCACRVCGLPVRVGTARGAADDRECFWARCDVCGHLARSSDGEWFPLITVAEPGVVGVRLFGGTRPSGGPGLHDGARPSGGSELRDGTRPAAGSELRDGTRPAGGTRPLPSARVVVDIDDGGGLHTRSVHSIAAGDEVRVRCDTGGSGPSLRVRALVLSGFAMWFARATVPSAELLGSPSHRREGSHMRGNAVGQSRDEDS